MTGRPAAVHNNAVWCDVVCRALGCDTTWVDGLWVNRSVSPPYYPNAATVSPDDTAAQVGRVRTMLDGPLSRPWSIKDGYRALDLAELGLEVLFEAEWIGLPPGAPLPAPADELAWSPVTDDAGLAAWEMTWRGEDAAADVGGLDRLFRPALLADPDIRFLAGRDGWQIVAVAVANRSDDGSGPVVGISNIVLGGKHPERYRTGAVAAARAAFPGLPMMGYQRATDLKAMLGLGFRPLGPLRVWLTPS